MSSNLPPLQVCERLIGKPEQLSVICGKEPKTAYAWRHASLNRGAGDLPSTRDMRALLAYAAAHQIPLTADHLIWGASEEELAALVASLPTAPTFSSRREAAE
ncbi:MAG: hypothetical protein V4712_15140 [Pseudomonadota bacterium]